MRPRYRDIILGPNDLRSHRLWTGDDLSLAPHLVSRDVHLDDLRQVSLWRPPCSFSCLSSRSFNARRHTLTHYVPCLQMSSEGSSDRVNSGNLLEGNSLSSFLRVGRLLTSHAQAPRGGNRLLVRAMMPRGVPDQREAKMRLR